MTFQPGERVLIDRAVPAVFVRHLDEFQSIIRLGADTRVVGTVGISKDEG